MLLFFTLLISVLLIRDSQNCGSLLHMEIAGRAAEFFNATYKGVNVHQLLLKHPEILATGAVFPDSFYDGACFSGQYHDVSEATHWMTFIQASLDYFNQKYKSKAVIDAEGEQLLVFILGFISHDVADVLWHSLGIDQGFIDTMAQLNFNGNYKAAHTVADLGGDSVILYELNFRNGSSEKLKWYVPLTDMLNIFTALSIPFNETLMKTCAVDLMELETAAELEVFEKLYPFYISTSPFLASARFTDYFLGGINEMTSWTIHRWTTAFMYLESNGHNCTNTQQGGVNPLYWVCGQQPPIKPPPSIVTRKMITRMRLVGGQNKSIFTAKINVPIRRQIPAHNDGAVCKKWDYFLKKPYSMLGQALLSIDLNGDGYNDLIAGAPGFSTDSRYQEGRVFVVLGSSPSSGLTPDSSHDDIDLSTRADFIFELPTSLETITGRFGYAITALDFNDDSLLDIVISAPLHSQDAVNALYSGRVFIYYGSNNKASNNDDDEAAVSFSFNTSMPDVVIDCEMRYCNYGSSLSIGDVNGDNKADLIIGAPYASQSFKSMRQNGFVSVFFSGSPRKNLKLSQKDADLLLWGIKQYSWFGYSVITMPSCSLLIGAPAEHVILSNETKLQMAGAVYCYDWQTKKLELFASGQHKFANFGSALSAGHPNGAKNRTILAVSAPSDDNIGRHFGVVPMKFQQSGSVYLFSPPSTVPIGKLAGDRHYGAFGRFIQFVDLTNDGYDDLLIGAPVRQQRLTYDESTGEATGELFIYYGNAIFPKNFIGKVCRGDVEPCPEEQADHLLSINASRTQFASNVAVFSSNNLVQIVVAAQRSDQYDRQAGKLTVFNCNYSSSHLF